MPIFMVLERGSSTARIRAVPPTLPRSACRVARIAVGWWAKSSYTVTPLASPRSSRRRRALIKLPSALAASAGSTPTCRAAAMAIRPLCILCSPTSAHFTSPTFSPSSHTSQEEASVVSFFACQCPCSPTSSCSLQQPIDIVCFKLMSFSGRIILPLPGTIRTR